MAAVMLWFSIQQFLDPTYWGAYVPESVVALSKLSTTTLVYLNGTFELIFGILLLLGFKTRIAALLLGLHLLHIAYMVGYGETAIRDAGLALALLSTFLHGPDTFSIEYKNEINKL